MPELRDRSGSAAMVLVSIPILALVLNALSWLRYGTDLPYLDDWVEYHNQSATSLSLSHLFAPGNDTLYPVGRALDVIAQYLLGGNAVAYQFISMIAVLGSLLFLQWKLLTCIVEDPLVRASTFSLCIFMVCPFTYWGLQNIAYVQALPTICILTNFYILVTPGHSPVRAISIICVVGLISGFCYISGAVAIFTIGISMLAFAGSNPRLREPTFMSYGIALLLAGLATTAVQFADIIFHQAGQLHRPDAHWVMPYDGDYWMYMLGKFGRAFSLQKLPPGISLVIVLCVVLSFVLVFLLCVLTVMRAERTNTPEFNLALIYSLLFVAVFAYLNMISASRARLRPDDITASIEVFRFGFANRFHFFWITLLFPWTGVAIYRLMAKYRLFKDVPGAVAIIAFVFVALGGLGGVFGYASEYRNLSSWRSQEIACLQEKISHGEAIECPSVFPGNLSKAFVYARSIGASFTKYFPEGDLSPRPQPP